MSKKSNSYYPAISAIAGFAIVIIVQILVLFEIIPVTNIMGGTQSELNSTAQIMIIAAILIILLFSVIILLRAGLIGKAKDSKFVKIMTWIIFIYLVLNTLANLASPSMFEKLFVGSISLIIAISLFILARSKQDPNRVESSS